MSTPSHDRRTFLALLAGAVTPVALRGTTAAASYASGNPAAGPGRGKHPDPRPGIDASRIVPADQVPAKIAELFDRIRQIPHVVDGIRCQCGCAELPGIYSLLSCYEGSGMAQDCMVCQAVGDLAFRLHRDGRTLDEIRAAVDRRSW